MTLDNCIKCKNHISFYAGYVVCNFWKQNQQHVTTRGSDGMVHVVGCSINEKNNE